MLNGTKRRRGYARGTVDFFAMYIIPTDDWYIFPYEVIGERDRNLFFRPEFWRQKYGEYREAWNLLVNAAKGRAHSPIDIHACCDQDEVAHGRERNCAEELEFERCSEECCTG